MALQDFGIACAVCSQCLLKVLCDVGEGVVDLFGACAVLGALDAILREFAENDDARHDIAKPIKVSKLEFEPLVAHIVTGTEPKSCSPVKNLRLHAGLEVDRRESASG